MTQDAAESLAETMQLNSEFKTLAEEGVRALQKANLVQRGLARSMLKRGLGMTPEQLRDEVRDAAQLLERLHEGKVDMQSVRPGLVRYADILARVAQYAGSLESQIDKFIKDPAQREHALEEGREKIELARRLIASIRVLTS